MNTKILWLSDSKPDAFAPDPEGQDIIFANMLNFAQSVARPGTEFDIKFVDKNHGKVFAPHLRYPRVHLAVEVVERIMQAEEEGYDAAFAGMCYGEFFLQDARQAVTMPVVGAAESSMILAQMLGKRFGVLTVASCFEHVMEENIRARRWDKNAISYRPVRSWEATNMSDLMLDAYAGRPDQLIEEFDKRAQALVRDGADVVICGCNPYGAALAQVGYNQVSGTGVPVVTPLAAMIKFAESLVDLRRSLGLTKSEAVVGPYQSTPQSILDDFAASGVSLRPFRDAADELKEVQHAA